MEKQRLPIGTEDFEKLRHENLYYVDKTGLIRELFNNFSEVTLFTRPRRFGKSLNMSMLRHFLEIGTDRSMFEGLSIGNEKVLCEQHMGQYPVIMITLKGVEGKDYEDAAEQVRQVIKEEAARYSFLMKSDQLDEFDKEEYKALRTGSGNLEGSLRSLSQLVYKHYGKKAVILIDEYDVPLDKAYQHGYYDQMILLIRRLFSAALKTNEALQFAILTGCLRISKESIFTGFNNLSVNTVVDDKYDEWFGFTDSDVRSMLDYYGLSSYYELTREWYDGYRFGQVDIYCPWDVINWCDQLLNESEKTPKNFWVNTSGNDMIIRFVQKADHETRDQIEALIAGESVFKKLQLDLTYPEIDSDDKPDYLWSVLFTTGYLTQRGMNEYREYELFIPNREIRSVFMGKIDQWFSQKIYTDVDGLREMSSAFRSGDTETVQDYLNWCMSDSISFFDGGKNEIRENFYHGMLIGMLKTNKKWRVYSNREAGNGRADIIVEPAVRTRNEDFGIIIEVKYALEESQLEAKAQQGLTQIKDKQYDDFFGSNKPKDIKHYGIAFHKKVCRVVN